MEEAGDFRLRQGFTVPLITLDGRVAGFSFGAERLQSAVAGLIAKDLMAEVGGGRVALTTAGGRTAATAPVY